MVTDDGGGHGDTVTILFFTGTVHNVKVNDENATGPTGPSGAEQDKKQDQCKEEDALSGEQEQAKPVQWGSERRNERVVLGSESGCQQGQGLFAIACKQGQGLFASGMFAALLMFEPTALLMFEPKLLAVYETLLRWSSAGYL